ncbi:MAG: hypothetical protein RJA34_1221 [Pseudomonadota bacterium]
MTNVCIAACQQVPLLEWKKQSPLLPSETPVSPIPPAPFSENVTRYEALQAALDLIDQGITLINEDLQMVAWNRTFLRLLDFPDELAYLGAPFEGFIRYNAQRGEYGPGDPELQTQQRVAAARAFTVHEIERLRPNGTVLSVRGVPVPGHGFVTLYSDVTDQRRDERLIREQNTLLETRVAERTAELRDSNAQLRHALGENEAIAHSLARSEAQMRLITDSIPALVAYFGSDRRYHYVNRGYRDWFGLDPTHPKLITAREYLGPDTYARIRPHVMRAIRGEAVTFEYDVATLHQGTRVARTSLIPDITTEREVVGCFELTFDITDERRAQEQLARAQKMEALGQLTGGLAHDFNNILTVVLGNLSALAELPALQPYAAHYVQPAIEAAQRGSNLIKGLLSFARKHPLESRQTDLHSVVHETHQLLRHTLPDTLALRVVPGSVPLLVQLDPNQLQNALINLVLNARDATDGRGEVLITSEPVALDALAARALQVPAGNYARLKVQDNGCGMDQATLMRVFEPFFTTKAPGQGTGLGMSMVYGFVQQSDGSIDIRSEPGVGSCVAMLFPLNDPGTPQAGESPGGDVPGGEIQATAAEAASDSRDTHQTSLALLVEDDAGVRQLVRRQLLDLGFSVLEAENATEAIDILNSIEGVQLLLSDVVMPGTLDGRDVARHALALGRIPRVVLMSGYVPDQQPIDGIALLSKPFSRAQLQQVLQGDRA